MAKEDISLELGIQFKAAEFKKAYEKTFEDMQKSAKRASDRGRTSVGGFVDKMVDSFTKVPKAVKNAEKAIKDYNKQAKIGRELQKGASANYKVALAHLKTETRALANLGDAATATQKQILATAQSETAVYKKRLDAVNDFYRQAKEGAEKLKENVEDMKFDFSGTKFIEAAEEAGKELAEPLSALLNKDVEGAGKSFAKLVGKGVQGSLSRMGDLVSNLGAGASKKSKAMAAAGGAGGASKALGAIGGMAKSIGPMIQALSKVGPLIGTVGTAVVGLVKLFLDAQAAVKEFNKEMLSAGGTGQFFNKTMGDVTLSMMDAEDALNMARNAANNFTANNDWGISADTHKEVLANLQAEGVSLKSLTSQYGQLNAQSSAFSKDFGSVTQAAVAYSRQMGVSLQEVTSFQAEMMTEMGSSLGATIDSFRMMSRAAGDSGIASNKFFAMIRGVSADLSLYNTRLDDAVKLLGKLGKVMSPRNAQKFMQWSMNAVKGMGRIQRLQTTLLAGPGKVKGMVERDIKDKTQSISDQIAKATGGNSGDIQKLLAGGKKKEVNDLISKADPAQQGALREAVSMLNIEKKRSGKGTYGVAQAAGQMAPVRQASMLDEAIKRFGSVGDIGAEQMAENLGVSSEQLEQMELFRDSMDDQRKVLIDSAKTAEDKAKWTNATLDQVYDTMSAEEKSQLEAKGKEEEYNKQMGSMTHSIMDKISNLVDFLTNQFYNVVMDIYEAILSIPGVGGGSKKRELELVRNANKSTNLDVKAAGKAAAMASEGEKGTAFRESLEKSASWKKVTDTLAGGGTDEADKAKMDTANKLLAGMDAAQLGRAASMAGVELEKNPEGDGTEGKGGGETRDRSELTPEEIVKIAQKALWSSNTVKDFDNVTKSLDAIAPEGAATTGAATAPGVDPATGSTWMEQNAPPGAPGGPPLGSPAAAAVPVAGAAPGAAAASAPPTAKDTEKQAEAQTDQQEKIQGTLGEVVSALRQKGIRLDNSWMTSKMQKMVTDATLESTRQALLEYWILENTSDPKAWADFLKDKGTGGAGLRAAGDWFNDTAGKGGDLQVTGGAKHADGGVVTGISNGMAMVAAPGEGLTSIGRGEQIVPAGSGRKTVIELSLKDNLLGLIDARVQDGIVKHAAATKFR